MEISIHQLPPLFLDGKIDSVCHWLYNVAASIRNLHGSGQLVAKTNFLKN